MKYSKSHILVALLISVLLLAGVPVNPVYASSIIVTNTNDSGVGSLRQALVDIAPGGTITFDSSLSGATIQLAATLTLDKNVTIDGSSLASQVTISGDTDGNGTGNVRVFDVNHNVTATLNNLAITKGTNRNISSEIGGGGISNLGTLTVLNCVFSDNSADRGGGIFNTDGGTLTVLNSTFAHNSAVTDDGGGIANWNGTLTITDSAFSYNSAYYAGGGIFNAGTVTTVLNNTFSNNSAIYGGGIANWYVGIITVTGSTFSNNSSSAYGGGLYINSGTGTVTNSTFSGNTTGLGGGGIYNYGTLTVRNSTVSGNVATSFGGGIFNDRTLNYTNTLIANSTGGDCVNNLGTVDTNTKNLVEDGGCSAGLSGDPNLGTLASNGGSTQTFALLAGSSAIDAGDDASCPITDQRGISRLQGAHCDIGAYEFENSPTTYDAFADFSPVSNPPSGSPWMYGYTWTLGGAFDIYTALRHDIDRELSILWTRPENFITPNVNKNISGVDIINVDGCILHPAITYLNLHPGQNNEFSVLRWTAPVDGTFRIDSAFKSLRFCGQATTTDAHVLYNSTSIYDLMINEYMSAGEHEFSSTLNLNSGDTIDFVVGVGQNGNYGADSTGLRAVISLVSTSSSSTPTHTFTPTSTPTNTATLTNTPTFTTTDTPTTITPSFTTTDTPTTITPSFTATPTSTFTPSSTPTIITLLDSQYHGLAGATVQYYDQGWHNIPGSTDTDGILNYEDLGLSGNVTFRITYANASIQKQQNITNDPTVRFQTVSVNMQLLTSDGSTDLMGNAQYYSNGWHTFGGGDTNTTMELLPLTYSFRVTYGGASVQKQQNISNNPAVLFQTKLVTMKLLASDGITELSGIGQYYANGWKNFGNSSTSSTMELLPTTYTFRVSYGGASIQKQQDISADSLVMFQTKLVTMKLLASDGITELSGIGQYYANGWKNFGNSSTSSTMELLPTTYTFRVSYGGASVQKQQDVSADSLVIFQTGQVHSNSNSATQYYANGWKIFVQNMELLPTSFAFRFSDGTPQTTYVLTAGIITDIH